jgi:colanic acid biosynthesis glycosyl transferase WcaI
MLQRLRDKGLPERQCVLFPNWVDTSFIFPLPGLPPEPKNKIVALYSGTTGSKQGLDLLIEAARFLKGRSYIEIVICGPGTAGLRARAIGCDNIRFLPLQPVERLNFLLNSADIHLLPQKPSAADLVMPSKLLGMVASGRPIIATAEPGTEVARVVSKCGIVVRPDDPAALASAIVELAADPDRRCELGRRAREFALAYCEKDVIIATFEREILSRLPESQSVPQEAS